MTGPSAIAANLGASPLRRARPAIRNAARIVIVGAVIGLVGQLLLYDVGVGINAPILVALLLGAGWMLRRPLRRPMLRDLWLAPASVVFAGFAAVRADPNLVALDLLTALVLAGVALASFGGSAVVARPIRSLLRLMVRTLEWVVSGAAKAIAAARRRLPPGLGLGRARLGLPVLRGLLIAVPVVIVFVSLFAAADAIFARMLEDLVRVDLELGDLPGRLLLAAVIGWMAIGGLALAASRGGIPATDERPIPWRLGQTEALTVLVAVDATFLGFVALQGAYLFGGLDTMQAVGMTYSDYARRGFFELVTVAALAGVLVVALDQLIVRRSMAWLVASIGLVVLTGAVLASAAMRLRLYQEAYGWTELRLYVIATIIVLGVSLGALIVGLATDRVRWIGHVMVATTLGAGLALNVIGPVRFITEQNVARAVDPGLVPENGNDGLDAFYLASLGDDAVPALVRALPVIESDEGDFLRTELRFRLEALREDDALNAWQAWNAGRQDAREALERAAREGLLD